MTLRLATLNDVERMHAIRMSVVENALRDPSRVTHSDYREMMHESRGRGWVFELDDDDDALAGFGVADHATRSIWALFVKPGYERRNIGRALHDAMIAWLFTMSDTPLWLTTEPNTRAHHFYLAAGWIVDPETVDKGGDVRLVRKKK